MLLENLDGGLDTNLSIHCSRGGLPAKFHQLFAPHPSGLIIQVTRNNALVVADNLHSASLKHFIKIDIRNPPRTDV